MALGTTNITTTLVRNTLSEDSNSVGDLGDGLENNINKWSKKKPVRGTFPTSSNGKYGIDVANSWAYLKPRGLAYSEGYRLGDFRGYEHDQNLAFPPIQCRAAELGINTLYPINDDGRRFANVWKVRFFRGASDVRLTPADLGLDDYYFGLKITNANGTFYKTQYKLNNTTYVPDGSGDGYSFTVNATLSDPTVLAFYDLPYGTGTYSWEIFLSSTATNGWTTTAPSDIIYFPDDSSYTIYPLAKSGSFTVANWISASVKSFGFESEIPGYATSKILFASGGTFSITNDISSWCTVQVWDSSLSNMISHEESWISGRYVKIIPDQNYDSARGGAIQIATGSGATRATVTLSIQQDGAYVAPSATFDSAWVNSSQSYAFNSNILTPSFTPSNLSSTSVPIYVYILRNNISVGYDESHSARNGYLTSFGIDLNETPGSGYQYKIILSTTKLANKGIEIEY